MVGGVHGRGAMLGGGTCMAGGVCVAGGMHGRGHAWQGACMVGIGACMARGCVWWGLGVHGRYYEMQSMSGQYASYWNAFFSKLGGVGVP